MSPHFFIIKSILIVTSEKTLLALISCTRKQFIKKRPVLVLKLKQRRAFFIPR